MIYAQQFITAIVFLAPAVRLLIKSIKEAEA